MSGIRKLIEEGQLDKAKNEIFGLEAELSREKSKHVRMSLLKQIQELKQLYTSRITPDTSCIEGASRASVVELASTFQSNASKVFLRDLKAEVLDPFDCVEAKIEDCAGIKALNIICKTSLLLQNVTDSDIRCCAQQIRLINCKNVRLEAFSETGVFLQDSSSITVSKSDISYNSSVENKFNEVYDFSCPYGSVNYQVIQ